MRDADLRQVLATIYDAPNEPSRWRDFLSQIAQIGNFNAGSIHFEDSESHEVGWATALNIDAEYERSYREYYAAINPWQQNKKLLVEGRVNVRRMAISDDTYVATEFYNDWARPLGLFDLAAVIPVQCGSVHCGVTLFRPKNAEPCGVDEMELLQTLMPHLGQAMRLHRRIAGLENRCHALSEALDHVPFGIVVLNSFLRVLLFNRTAKTILDQRDGITLRQDTLTAGNAREQSQLQFFLKCAVKTASDAGFGSGGAMTISRPSCKRAYSLLITPLRPNVAFDLQEPAVAIFLSDAELNVSPPATSLARLYKLTAAEARLAQLLAQGKDLTEAGRELGITRNTVKRQLQAIFQKTDTKRQAELVRLLTIGPGH